MAKRTASSSTFKKIIAINPKALHNYEIVKKYEAGISLIGGEVKSIRARRVSLLGSFVRIKNGEAVWIGGYIAPWMGNLEIDPRHPRTLLLNRSEIDYLLGRLSSNLTIVPISVYTIRNLVKLEIGLAKSRKKSDKRALEKKRQIEENLQREIKEINTWG